MPKRLCLILPALLALAGALPLSARAADPVPPAAAAPQAAAPRESVRIKCQIFRIRGNVSGDTSLTDDIWAGKPPADEKSKPLAFFTTARMVLAGARFTVDERGWRINDRELAMDGATLPALGDGVLPIASPHIISPYGEAAAFNIGSNQPIDYFDHMASGLYQLKKSSQPTGLSMKVFVEHGQDGRIRLHDMTFTTTMVESRKPLEGTTLNVGEPVISKREVKADIHLKPGRDYGFFFFTSDGQGTLLVRLRVEPAPPDGLDGQVKP